MGHGVIVHEQELLCFRNPKCLFDCYTNKDWPYHPEQKARVSNEYLLHTTGIADCLGIGFRVFVSGEVVSYGLYHSASEHGISAMRDDKEVGIVAFFATLKELLGCYDRSHVDIYTHQGSSDKYELQPGNGFEQMLGEVLRGVNYRHIRLTVTPMMAMQVARLGAYSPKELKPDSVALLLLRVAVQMPTAVDRERVMLFRAIQLYLTEVERERRHQTSLRAIDESLVVLEQGASAAEGVRLLLRRKSGMRLTVFAGGRYQALVEQGFERDRVRELYRT